MKKLVALVLAIIVAFGCVSAFATAPWDIGPQRGLYGKVEFNKAVSVIGESFLSNDITSVVNEIREDWTNSRGLDGPNIATFVNIGTEDNVNVAVEVKGTMYAIADCNANQSGSTENVQLTAYVDLKSVEDAGFCGLIMDQTSGYNSVMTSFGSVTEPDSGETMASISGYGFTLRSGNRLEVFANNYADDSWTDSGIVDLDDFAIDSSEWNTYAIYRTTEKKAYVTVNNILVSIIDCGNWQILEADGETVLTAFNGTPDDTYNRYNTDGTPMFVVVNDDDTDIFFDNIGYEEFAELPTFDKAHSKLKNASVDLSGQTFSVIVDVALIAGDDSSDFSVVKAKKQENTHSVVVESEDNTLFAASSATAGATSSKSVEFTFSNGKFVSEPIDLNDITEEFNIELCKNGEVVDKVENFSVKNYLEKIDDTLAADVLSLASALEVYNGGEGFEVTGASEVWETLPARQYKKVAHRDSADDYVESATLRIDEDVNVVFNLKTTNATKVVIKDSINETTITSDFNRIYSENIAIASLGTLIHVDIYVGEDIVADADYAALDYVWKYYNASDAKLAAVCQALFAIFMDADC